MVEATLRTPEPFDRRTFERCEAAVAQLSEDPTRPVGDIAAALGVSHGYLDRQFTEQVGLSPRTLARILRMRRLLEEIDVHGSVGWADKAADLGWFDQAHLIRDFKRHTGVTPSRTSTAQRSAYDRDEVDASAGFVPEDEVEVSRASGEVNLVRSRRRRAGTTWADHGSGGRDDDRGFRRRDHHRSLGRCGVVPIGRLDRAARWMSGVDALRADGPTAVGTNWCSPRGVSSARAHRRPGPGTPDHAPVRAGGGDRRLRVRVRAARRGHPGALGRRLSDDRAGAAARTGDQVRRPPVGPGQLDAFAATFTSA